MEYVDRRGGVLPSRRAVSFLTEDGRELLIPTPIPIEMSDAICVVLEEDELVIVSIERNGSVIWPTEHEA